MSKKSGLADSPFFIAPTFKSTKVEKNHTGERVNARSPERPKSHSGNRDIKRQSYNVYVDQHEALKRLEATSRLSGKPQYISEMLREAIDNYLKKHR